MSQSKSESPKPNWARPGDRWECGLARAGFPCQDGPNHRGVCPRRLAKASAEEAAAAREAEKARVAGSSIVPDDEAPVKVPEVLATPPEMLAPCRPRRALWWRRRRLSRSLGLFTLGGLVLLLLSQYNREIVAPGELSSAHGQILEMKLDSNRCAVCHPAADDASLSWLSPIDWSHSETTQTERCLECHRNQLPEAVRKTPHDFTPEQLATLSSRATAVNRFTSLASWMPKSDWKSMDLTCSACHKEHAGRENDLQAMANQKCQSCHIARFQSLANGHPEFANYPYDRPRSIAFDHQSHKNKYFAQKNEAFQCNSCHVDNSQQGIVGTVFRAVSFEASCARCHEQPLRNSIADGMIVFQLPSVSRKQIEAAGLELGAWPEEAGQLADGTIAPVMKWLLASDPEAEKWLNKLPASGNLADLDANQKESAEVQHGLALSVRKLLEEIARDGQPAIEKRIAGDLAPDSQGDSEKRNMQQMTAGIPPDLFRAAYKEWFAAKEESELAKRPVETLNAMQINQPSSIKLAATQDDLLGDDSPEDSAEDLLLGGMEEESGLESSESSEASQSPKTNWPSLNPMAHVSAGGWMIDTRRLAIAYIPKGHADPWQASWLEQAATRLHGARAGHALTPVMQDAAKQLLDAKAPGNCAQCHALPGRIVGVGWENVSRWKAVERPAPARMLTRFDHSPHLVLPKLKDCTSCHRLLPSVETSEANSAMASSVPSPAEVLQPVRSEFASMKLDDCKDCHTPSGAGDGCITCHNYHVGQAGWEWDFHVQSKTKPVDQEQLKRALKSPTIMR